MSILRGKSTAFIRRFVTDFDAFRLSSERYAAGDVIELIREGYTYEVAPEPATDHHLKSQGGTKFYVLPKEGRVSIRAFGALGDGVTDDTDAIQMAVNFSSNRNVLITVPPGDYLCSKLHGYHDATLNPGFNPAPNTAGNWGLAGVAPISQANTVADATIGARLVSTETSGCPFEFIRPTDETNAFYARKLVLRNIAFKGATADAPVLRTNKIQEPVFQNVHVLATGAISDAIWECVDCDQHDINDVTVVGPGSGTAGSVGYVICQEEIDASRGHVSGLMVRDVEIAGYIGGPIADVDSPGEVIRNMQFNRMASKNCVHGPVFGGKLERVIFNTPQCRGEKTGATLRGQQTGCLYLTPSFQATSPAAADDYEAQLVIGHPDATSGSRKFASCVIESPDFPNVPAGTPAIRWRGATRLGGMSVRQPTAYLADAAARLVHFSGTPTGGSLTDAQLYGGGFTPELMHLVDETGSSPLSGLNEFSFVADGELFGWSGRNRFSGHNGVSTPSQASISLVPAFSHTISGTTAIETITIDGQNPPNGTQIVLLFNAANTLLSTTGSGNGNIKFDGGDLSVTSLEIVALTWMNGGWRAAFLNHGG